MNVLLPWREWHRPLMANASLMLGLVVASGVGIIVDDRTLLGESVWVKPLKFGLAFALYSGVLAWLLTNLRRARRFGWWAGTAFAMVATVEVTAIAIQAARGTFSHFNADLTDPVTQAITQVLTFGVAGLFLAQLAIATLVLVQGNIDPVLGRAVRWGLVLSTVGMFLPIFWLITSIHQRTVVDANGHAITMYQGHGIGDPDGHGMPVTNWSVTGGDFRVPHFVGLHAIHVLLLTTLALAALGRRQPWLRPERVRVRLVLIAALAYAGLIAILAWQAGRGQPLIHPDARTLIAAAVVFGSTLVAAVVVVIAARREPAAPQPVLAG